MNKRQSEKSRFIHRLEIRAPKALPDAVAIAAGAQMTTGSEYVRRALLKQLAADGIDLPVAA